MAKQAKYRLLAGIFDCSSVMEKISPEDLQLRAQKIKKKTTFANILRGYKVCDSKENDKFKCLINIELKTFFLTEHDQLIYVATPMKTVKTLRHKLNLRRQ